MEVARPKLVVDVNLEPSCKPRWTLADAILADLETSATPRNIYENRWETSTTTDHAVISPLASRIATLNRSQGSCSPDFPLPAQPLNNSTDGLQDPQEYYRTRSPGQPVYSSTITISKSVYNPDENEDEFKRNQSISPGPSRFDHTSQLTKAQYRTGQHLSPGVSEPTRLSNNLSELDSLLDDLSSEKFCAEVDKTNTLGHRRISPHPTGTLRSQPGSQSGTLQREKEIPKLIVPSIQPSADYGNYDDLGSCRNTGIQDSFIQRQNYVTSYSLPNRPIGMQDNLVPTNVQRPLLHHLHPVQSQDQHAGGSPSPTFQMQKLQHPQEMQLHHSVQQQHTQPMQFPEVPEIQQQRGQMTVQAQGQGTYDSLGRGPYDRTVTERYTEERFVNRPPESAANQRPQQHFANQTTTMQQQQISPQPLQQQRLHEMSSRQQATGQPLQPVEQHKQVIFRETVTARGPWGVDVLHGRTSSASRNLEDLMTSFSEFDISKDGVLSGDPLYSQPVKTIQVPIIPTGKASGDTTDTSGFRNSQDQSSSGYLSVSHSGCGDYDIAMGKVSPGPHEMIIQQSPSTLGHPVPSTVYLQDQNSSKMIVTQGMHGVFPRDRGGGVGGGGGGQAGEGRLETMLSQLGNDLSQQGILTLPKGDCAACNKPIVGQVLMALGKIWHPEHFVCVHCRQTLGTNTFFERDGQPYCENDYQVLFSPKCALCGGAILEKCITALNKTWHPEHFFCAQCQRPFGDEGFHEQNGLPFCRDDYFCMFAPKCGGCGNAILSNYCTALQRHWHPDCFVCRECYAPFDSGSFFDHNGLPYCEQHFHARRGSLCASCQKPIMGRCITAMSRKFHPEHFVCVFCLQPLNKGTFKEQSNKPYCHQCFEKLFG